jgi:ssDNA-binding Zn-finger/Zn-ribbon topoisomerase 1
MAQINKRGIQTDPKPRCPTCNKKMKLREPKQTEYFQPYWYCSQYPDCFGRRDILYDGRPDFSDDYIE